VRRDLARTLERIAESGSPGFYEGPVARALVNTVQSRGGALSLEDLRRYRAVFREPLRISYRGLAVEIMPPPSAGGVTVAQTLLMLQELGAERLPRGSAEQLHLFIEASRRAQAERRFSVVDPDSLPPAEALRRRSAWLDPHHLLRREPGIHRELATPSHEVHALFEPARKELEHTTHLSVADGEGNVVSCTTTLSASFGAKILVPAAGVVLNNAVASFATAGENLPTAGRRTTSSMAPTLVLRHEQPVLVLGSPGGDTIPSTVVQVLRNVVDHGMTLDEAIDAPRVHHGFVPDKVRLERGNRPAAEALAGLEKRGHRLLERGPMGDANNILMQGTTAWAYADRREGGLAAAAKKIEAAPPDATSETAH
jgi:gamma-glutamyltranspeptidase/glutathione hydrolase